MIFTYFKRGKCSSCGDILWTTEHNGAVQCACNASKITPVSDTNIELVTDEEHIAYISIHEIVPEGETIQLVDGSTSI